MDTTTLMTADDLWKMADDGYRYELIRGELHRMSPTGGAHSWIGMEFGGLLRDYVVPGGLGEVFTADCGYIFATDPDTVLAPDVSFIRADRLPPWEEWRGFFRLPPDLVVEVVSPFDRQTEIDEKIRLYLDFGVPLVFVVYPDPRTVVAPRPGIDPVTYAETDEVDGGEVVPGFRLPVSALFRRAR